MSILHRALQRTEVGVPWVTRAEFAEPHDGVGWQQISDTTLDTAVSEISIPVIPDGYRSLMLDVILRATNAAANTQGYMQFNGDTGANYDQESLRATAASPTSFESLAATQAYLGDIAGNTAVAGATGTYRVWIPNYADATFLKTVVSTGTQKSANGTSGVAVWLNASFWRSTAAITSIRVFPGAGNFAIASAATLWAMG